MARRSLGSIWLNLPGDLVQLRPMRLLRYFGLGRAAPRSRSTSAVRSTSPRAGFPERDGQLKQRDDGSGGTMRWLQVYSTLMGSATGQTAEGDEAGLSVDDNLPGRHGASPTPGLEPVGIADSNSGQLDSAS